MAKSKKTGKDFSFPSHQPQSMWGDERGEDQGKEPGREGINRTETKSRSELDLGLGQ